MFAALIKAVDLLDNGLTRLGEIRTDEDAARTTENTTLATLGGRLVTIGEKLMTLATPAAPPAPAT